VRLPLPHRITVDTESGLHVVVEHEGVRLADSRRPAVLREGKLRPRYYLPPEDVRLDLLQESPARSHCPFKGDADYYAHEGVDVAWVYREVIEDGPPVAGMIAFYDERVDLTATTRA
jgi:uncharacterized protein (DUF427 family)